jgi:hypothetical protein
MADLTRRVQKKMQEFLEPGEEVLSAILVEPKGAYGLGMIGHVVANNATTKFLQESARKKAQFTGGLVSTFPTKPFVVTKTSHRILIAESNGIKFMAPSVIIKHGQLKITDRKRKLLAQRLTLACYDGSTMIVDAQLGQPVDQFV